MRREGYLYKMSSPLKLFVSRSLDNDSPLKQLAQDEGIHLTAESLIKISRIPFSFTPPAQWVFFSSKNSIINFFEQNPVLSETTKFAVIGTASAESLRKYEKEAHFIGSGTDLKAIAQLFKEKIGNDSVLFPQAIDSLQTIQKQLAFSNTSYNLYTYKTNLRADFQLPTQDILVFTSPSNARAYFSKYRAEEGQRFVAMGTSTRYALAENGIRNCILPESFTEEGLKDAVLGAMNLLAY
jgi:uroporphyrinogen-III synthase